MSDPPPSGSGTGGGGGGDSTTPVIRRGIGRSSRGRAVRNVTAGSAGAAAAAAAVGAAEGLDTAARPPSRGTITPGAAARISPTSTVRQFDDLSLGSSNGDGNGNGNGDISRYEPSPNGDNGHEANGNGNGDARRRPSPPNGNGNGNGNGRGDHAAAGLRGAPDERRELTLGTFDIVRTRPPELLSKKGAAGRFSSLVANYFEVRRTDDWGLYQHRVDFSPEDDRTGFRKYLIRQHKTALGAYIFDGTLIYTVNPLHPLDGIRELESVREEDGARYQIRIRLVGKLDPNTPMYIQFYNLVVKNCQEGLKMIQMGRNFFDCNNAIDIPAWKLQMFPGFVTALRQHENSLLMCVEMTHKVIRTEHVLQVMVQTRRDAQDKGQNYEDAVRAALVGTIVMSTYNKKTYRVDDVIFNENPMTEFPVKKKGQPVRMVTFVDYYKERYDIDIRVRQQPLLASNPKPRDIRRGMTEVIKLIPELCQMTGLTQEMKNNYTLMKDLGRYLFMPPQAKLEATVQFVRRIRETPAIVNEMQSWGLTLAGRPVETPGRILPKEKVNFVDTRGQALPYEADDQADFTKAFRGGNRMPVSVRLHRWVLIVPQRESQGMDNVIQTMQNVARPLGFEILHPLHTVKLNRTDPEAYSNAVSEVITRAGDAGLQMIFTVLPNNRIEAYSAVKKRCYVDFGISSQCFLAKNVGNKGLMSICTKLVIQMNAKLGGEPWLIQIPMRKMMVVGFDVYHGGIGGGRSVGAMVATSSASYGRYFSTVCFHESRSEISTKIAGEMRKCVYAYNKSNNGDFPERIFFYRDGVGEGQLQHVYDVELEEVKKSLKDMYEAAGHAEPKLSYIIVTKRINTRLFQQKGQARQFENPAPGTIVDDVVTLPERYDFFLVAQTARQGTVSPTAYNVLWEKNGLDPDKVQRLSYKLCHGYYNWSGTVAVPAPCQYAHKLANLSGLATKAPGHHGITNLLYFL